MAGMTSESSSPEYQLGSWTTVTLTIREAFGATTTVEVESSGPPEENRFLVRRSQEGGYPTGTVRRCFVERC